MNYCTCHRRNGNWSIKSWDLCYNRFKMPLDLNCMAWMVRGFFYCIILSSVLYSIFFPLFENIKSVCDFILHISILVKKNNKKRRDHLPLSDWKNSWWWHPFSFVFLLRDKCQDSIPSQAFEEVHLRMHPKEISVYNMRVPEWEKEERNIYLKFNRKSWAVRQKKHAY